MGQGLGETLRQARTRREVDLAEVAEVTKIRVSYLSAIENEEWERLPGDAYVRPFVRTYGDFLGLDGAALARGLGERGVGAAEAAPTAEQLGGAGPSRRRGGRRARLALVGGVLAAVGVGLAIVLAATSGGGGGGSARQGAGAQPRPETGSGTGGGGTAQVAAGNGSPQPTTHTVSLTATAEVWVCLLDGAGQPLVDGRILAPGSSEGPYRSGNFTLSLGNGEVTMMVDGKQASIPRTPDPVGYAIDRGALRPLGEGERPTCT